MQIDPKKINILNCLAQKIDAKLLKLNQVIVEINDTTVDLETLLANIQIEGNMYELPSREEIEKYRSEPLIFAGMKDFRDRTGYSLLLAQKILEKHS